MFSLLPSVCHHVNLQNASLLKILRFFQISYILYYS